MLYQLNFQKAFHFVMKNTLKTTRFYQDNSVQIPSDSLMINFKSMKNLKSMIYKILINNNSKNNKESSF